MSDHTIAKELVTLRAALRLAKRAGLWLSELDAVLPAGFAPEYRPRIRALSGDELGQLLARLPAGRAAQVAFIVATSACWSESVRTRREDVQLDSGWVHVRGTKRAARNRRIATRHPALASLLGYALKHAPGEDELFPPWTNVCNATFTWPALRPALKPARPMTSGGPTWMRLARVPAEIVAPTMGHRDTRMVERVYGRLSAEEIGVLLKAHFADCTAGATDKVDLGGKNGRIGLSRTNSMPRGGIEAPTRGFSVTVAE